MRGRKEGKGMGGLEGRKRISGRKCEGEGEIYGKNGRG
jgi:hypothetical protein